MDTAWQRFLPEGPVAFLPVRLALSLHSAAFLAPPLPSLSFSFLQDELTPPSSAALRLRCLPRLVHHPRDRLQAEIPPTLRLLLPRNMRFHPPLPHPLLLPLFPPHFLLPSRPRSRAAFDPLRKRIYSPRLATPVPPSRALPRDLRPREPACSATSFRRSGAARLGRVVPVEVVAYGELPRFAGGWEG